MSIAALVPAVAVLRAESSLARTVAVGPAACGGAGIVDWAAGFSGVPGALGNKITYNGINESPIGLYNYHSGDTFVGNSFSNVTVLLYP